MGHRIRSLTISAEYQVVTASPAYAVRALDIRPIILNRAETKTSEMVNGFTYKTPKSAGSLAVGHIDVYSNKSTPKR